MPNTREKLIELIQSAVDGCATYWAGLIADHLIANGVTFAEDNNVPSKWISVKERLPEEDGQYLVFEKSCYGTQTRTLRFAKNAKKVDKYDFVLYWKNVWYRYDSEWGHITIDTVTHWMPLPEPPKGE